MRALAVSASSRIDGIPTLKEQGIDVELVQLARRFRRAGHYDRPARRAGKDLRRLQPKPPTWKTTLEKLGWAPIFLRRRCLQEIHRRRHQADRRHHRFAGYQEKIVKCDAMKAKPAELVHLAWRFLALGTAVAVGTSQGCRAQAVNARIGPNAAPAVVAGGLVLLGLWLLYEALSGGWRNSIPDQPEARGEHRFYASAFIWAQCLALPPRCC